jgi:branched-chain amino acid transport system substrate-binding protein
VKRSKRLLCVLGVLAALGAACSSSSKPSTSSATTTPQSSSSTSPAGASSSQASGAPIKVGVVCTCSGPFGGSIVPSLDVYKAWVNTINATGGIDGHQIQLITKDDASNPGTSASDAQALVAAHVVAIANMSNFDSTWASAVSAAGIPVVGTNSTEETFFTNPDFYPEGQTNDSSIVAVVATAKAAGAKTTGLMYCAEAPICQQGVPAVKAAGKAAGVPDVFNAEIAVTAPNYTAQCVAAQQAHVESLFIGQSSSVIARVGNDCARQGYKPIYLTEGEGYSAVLLSGAGLKDNTWSPYNDLPYWDTSNPSVQQMDTALDKYYPGLRSNTQIFSELSAMSWPSGILLEDAIKAGGLGAGDTPSATEIVKGLQSLHGDTLQGWSPPLTFTPGKPHPVSCWFTAHITGGVPSLVDGNKVTCVGPTS